ncbi:hypothetical protein BJX66DRAFT_261061 [Aspergillus keveii]|uniref:LYR motif-containing protein Cup1-like N-terminal domain-containing protein n=1 Tax=Aspergillus keveii TaxID=714993 RepID=A0ABR4FYM0_9EURO
MNRQFPFPKSEWRSILRSLLRESSYLPDPVARVVCREQILQRFRRYHEEPRTRIRTDYLRLMQLHKKARYNLSLLQRANEGISHSLEKVLQSAYGRRGRRRRELLANMLALDTPQDSNCLEALVTNPRQYEDGWMPPAIITTLLAAQNSNAAALRLKSKPHVRHLQPPIPETNAWRRKVPLVRRRNIRREWYSKVLGYLLPPLPDTELQVLEGLISGEIPWNPPKRRSKRPVNTEQSTYGMIRTVLTAGPPKGETFRQYTGGRPHKITRRFMQRLWRRISCIVPRPTLDGPAGKLRFTWDVMKSRPALALHVKDGLSQKLFGDGGGLYKSIPKVFPKEFGEPKPDDADALK